MIVVGGHSRNIGKTSLVVDLLRAFPAAAWTAVKITQYGHGVCSVNGEHCGCAPAEHPFSITDERDRQGASDTSRFLAAGAARAVWVRTKLGQLAAALPALRGYLAAAGNLLMESNSLLGFVRPRLYLAVLDPTQADFKESAQRYLDLADAFVFRSPAPPGWAPVLAALRERKPGFQQPLGTELPPGLRQMVAARFFAETVR
jgi:hypothetical protein